MDESGITQKIRRREMKKTYTQSAEEVLLDLGVGTEGFTTAPTSSRRPKSPL